VASILGSAAAISVGLRILPGRERDLEFIPTIIAIIEDGTIGSSLDEELDGLEVVLRLRQGHERVNGRYKVNRKDIGHSARDNRHTNRLRIITLLITADEVRKREKMNRALKRPYQPLNESLKDLEGLSRREIRNCKVSDSLGGILSCRKKRDVRNENQTDQRGETIL